MLRATMLQHCVAGVAKSHTIATQSASVRAEQPTKLRAKPHFQVPNKYQLSLRCFSKEKARFLFLFYTHTKMMFKIVTVAQLRVLEAMSVELVHSLLLFENVSVTSWQSGICGQYKWLKQVSIEDDLQRSLHLLSDTFLHTYTLLRTS
jgi:hypothetical protein